MLFRSLPFLLDKTLWNKNDTYRTNIFEILPCFQIYYCIVEINEVLEEFTYLMPQVRKQALPENDFLIIISSWNKH